jgi:hypothetical protein
MEEVWEEEGRGGWLLVGAGGGERGRWAYNSGEG